MDDLSLRTDFHRALDAVAPPAPWLADHVRRELRRRTQAPRSWPRKRSRLELILTPTSRKLIAAALVVVLAAVAVAASVAIHQYTHRVIPVIPHTGGPISRECGQGKVYMVDSNVGWRGTGRTTDGGKTWRDVSPPAPQGAIKGGGTVCALDPNHAWATWGTGTDSYQPTNVVVMSTHDGGQSWQQVGVIAIGYPVSWQISFTVEMDFLDLQHGWLLMEYATNPFVRTLYATSDGGAQWTVVSSSPGLGLGNIALGCSENGMMFSSLKTGWLTWDCSSGYGDQPPQGGPVIAFTRDGGSTWAPLNLDAYPTDRICGATTPIFSGSAGLLQVTCLGTGQGGWAALYSSADGGQTWAVHVLPVFATVDLVDGNTGFYFRPEGKANTLYRTIDGADHWTVVAAGLFPDDSVAGLTFIDARTGFVSVGNSPSPYWTHDGGKTWSLPGPYRSVGNTVCNVFSDPGAGPVPTAIKMVSPTIGWAGGARRTTDGGATWSNVNPPAPANRSSGYSEFFLDATHAWVADAAGSSTSCADHFIVYRTVDGGATWQEGTPTAVQLPAEVKVDGQWMPLIDFLDVDHGWLTLQPIGVMGAQPVAAVYSTSDGGRHWTMLPTPPSSISECSASGPAYFASSSTGWMRVFCQNQEPNTPMRFFVTRDGGLTWALKTVAESDGCCVNRLPEFFDGSHGWLLDTNIPLLLMTSDGGESWTSRGLPQFHYFSCQGKFGPTTCSSEGIITGTFINPNEGWIALYYTPDQGHSNYVQIQHTSNGGKTWGIVNSNLIGVNPAQGPEQMTFFDQSDGFIWTGTVLLRTTDGGQTWTAAHMTYGQ